MIFVMLIIIKFTIWLILTSLGIKWKTIQRMAINKYKCYVLVLIKVGLMKIHWNVLIKLGFNGNSGLLLNKSIAINISLTF